VEKWLDRFLVSDRIMELPLQFCQWVSCGGELDHSSFCLEIEGGPKHSSSPFKFNATWLSDEYFLNLVKVNWVGYDAGNNQSVAVQFVSNLNRIKQLVIPWAH
jgi:hypothetical protein